MKSQVTDWEKISAKHITDKGLVFKIYKEPLKCNNKKNKSGTSPVVQWLRLHASNAGSTGLIPGGKLRSHHPCHGAQPKK